MNTSSGVSFNDFNFAKLSVDVINFDGEIIVRGAEQIYSEFYDISDDRLKPYANRYNEFLTNFRDVEFNFVGDKFYEKYLK